MWDEWDDREKVENGPHSNEGVLKGFEEELKWGGGWGGCGWEV